MRILILLLYGAGLRLREAVDLTRADVDLNGSVLTIRNTKFGKTRLVPFGPQLGHALAQYAARCQAPRAEAPFFTTRMGTRREARHAPAQLPNPVRPSRHPPDRRSA